TWTVTDNAGNTATCTQIVTVVDTINPTIICAAPVTVNVDLASCTTAKANVTLGSPTTADNCGVKSVTNDAPSVFPIGNTTVTWTVTDNAGNTATCTQIVTVVDNINPTITCAAPVTVNVDAASCTTDKANVTLGSPTTADNCGVKSVTNDAPSVFPIGNTTVTWTVTDNAGNTATCTQIVTVVDNINPTITCAAPVTVNVDAASCTTDKANVTLGAPTTADNCGVKSVTNDAPSVFPIGNTTVTWTVTDNAGNTATCTQIVTVVDTINPTITCAAPVTVNVDAASCTTDKANVTLGAPTTADNCGVKSVTNDAPSVFPIGNTTVTWTVTDNAGNTATCTQIVTVVDNINPTITCAAPVTVNVDAASCTTDKANVTLGSPTTADNCGVKSVTNDAPSVFPIGNTTVTWTVTDNAGNTATCTQIVTVVDNINPTITCAAPVTVNVDAASCTTDKANVTLGSPTTADNCGVKSVINDAPSVFPIGNTTVTWTVTDNAGNTATCTQIVTVVGDIIANDDTGIQVNGLKGGISVNNVLINDILNCKEAKTEDVITTFISSTNTGVTLSGTDVVVAAGTPAGSYTLVYQICEILNPTNCDTATVTVTVTAPAIVANDDAGTPVNGANGGTAFTNVLVNDTLNGVPVLASQVVLTTVSSSNAGITLSGTDVVVAAGTPAGSYTLVYQICEILNPTNCDTATVTVSVTAPAIVANDDAGTPVNGANGGTAFTNVLVNDTLNGAPVLASQVVLTTVSSSNAGITLSGTDVVVAAGTPAGSYTLVYQICEILNPTNCDTATVTVSVTAPVIVANDDAGTPVNGANGGIAFTNVLVNDTLNGVPVLASQVILTTVSSSNAGVTLSGTDVVVAAGTPAGNYTLVYQICEILNPTNCDTATVTVTVTAPAIVANDDAGTNVNGANGGTAFTNVLVNDTLNDVPVLASQVILTTVSSSNAGITLSGTDVVVAAGTPAGSYTLVYQICEILNPTNCDTATVTVSVTAPVIVANDDIYTIENCTSSGILGNVLGNDSLNGNSLIASTVNITLVSGQNSNIQLDNLGNINTLTGTNPGIYILTYQICEKLNPENCDTATITITIKDITAPVIAQLPVPSTISCSITPNFAQATATDTCSSITLAFVDTTVQGSCIGSYTVTRTWTATDSAGNSATASQIISVQDTTGPTTTTEFAATINVNCDAIPLKPELIFADNCSTASPAIYTETITNSSQNSYSIVRKWPVSDSCGNISIFTQTVNVSVTNSGTTIASSACSGDSSPINIFNLLPEGTPTNGTWVDVDNTGALQGNILSPFGLSLGNKVFEYQINNVDCPRKIELTVNINDDCIVLGCGDIKVHNAFSPNGDGTNEVFVIDNIDDTACYPENTVEIYNRWGILVFETKNYNNQTNNFEGISRGRTTVNQSSGLPTGTYFYILNYSSIDGNGNIEIKKLDGYLYLTK
ncbi:HYR domain-containing protein, partial [Flavobacterium sp. W20_MBD1_R3]|uniref:HYR domain-containing protein n=1 Tax=Flavobacterium sp. W20_MBD1_R3 TaxID=3240278 RepID=UPI003F919580